MSIGFGPGANMQSEYNRNRGLLSDRKSLKELNKDYNEKDNSAYTSKASMSEQELEQFRAQFIETQKRRTRKAILVIGILAVVIAGFFVWILT